MTTNEKTTGTWRFVETEASKERNTLDYAAETAMPVVGLGIALFGLFTVFLQFTAFPVLGGWAISKVWGWFAVPLGAPVLSLVNAIGLDILSSLFLIGLSPMLLRDPTPPEYRKMALNVWSRQAGVLICVAMAYVFKQFL
jgi:hypothetical protein